MADLHIENVTVSFHDMPSAVLDIAQLQIAAGSCGGQLRGGNGAIRFVENHVSQCYYRHGV